MGALSRKRPSGVGNHCTNKNPMKIREGSSGRNQSQEEPSTLEGVASISRDDAPSGLLSNT